MENMTLKIDPETRDMVFDENGMPELIYDSETTVQNVRHALLTWKGEFFADETHGTDYEAVMGVNQNDIETGEIEEVIRDAVFQDPEIASVDSMDITYDSRTITAVIQMTLDDGEEVNLEVTA
ncbi:MAG: DUF2634 domain-containing protein [Lachnospiraceae bacterium]|nr:DUF2634 domain-containing protein [Clostridia bacterium]MBR1691185.1 DUF2634 domain-containing protein [Lachnospiraceae bacterium]